jgi:hypothetical protein
LEKKNKVIVPRVMGLEERYKQAVVQSDEDTCRIIARLITEMAESYTDLLLSNQEMNQTSVVALVLMCSSSEDMNIAEVTLRFWYFFVLRWYELREWDDHTHCWRELEQLKAMLQQRLLLLLWIVVAAVFYCDIICVVQRVVLSITHY